MFFNNDLWRVRGRHEPPLPHTHTHTHAHTHTQTHTHTHTHTQTSWVFPALQSFSLSCGSLFFPPMLFFLPWVQSKAASFSFTCCRWRFFLLVWSTTPSAGVSSLNVKKTKPIKRAAHVRSPPNTGRCGPAIERSREDVIRQPPPHPRGAGVGSPTVNLTVSSFSSCT